MKRKKNGKGVRAGDRASARHQPRGPKPDPHEGHHELHSIRESIDDIDRRIHELLNERARYAQQVGDSKRSAGSSTADFYKPEREAQVLRQALERNKGPLRNEEIARLFREIMSACLAQQEPLKVTFLGPEGTFSQQAVLKHFGHSVRALPLASIGEVFEEVQAGHADFGVVPIENSTEGTVNNTLDMFLTSPLKICGEVELRIHQHVMGRMHGLEKIVRVCSHQQSLAQCRQWLDEYLPNAERVPVSSNAEAARRARDEDGTARQQRRCTASTSSSLRSRMRRTTPRVSSSSVASCSAPAATTRRRCWCRPAIPSRPARCTDCSVRWRSTASA